MIESWGSNRVGTPPPPPLSSQSAVLPVPPGLSSNTTRSNTGNILIQPTVSYISKI